MRVTQEMIEAAAKESYKLETGLEDESWYRAYGVERELWRDQSRSVLEAALAVAPQPVQVDEENLADAIKEAERSTNTGSRPHRHRIIARAVAEWLRGDGQ